MTEEPPAPGVLWDVELGLGQVDTLTETTPPEPDPAVERAVAAAKRAGGVELERGLGFARVHRCP